MAGDFVTESERSPTITQSPEPSRTPRARHPVPFGIGVDPDADLMSQVSKGDVPSFDLLHAKYRRPIINFLFRIVHDRSVAEELTQEVFLRVFRSRGSYVRTAKFTTWLFRIALHRALSWRRDGKKARSDQRLDEVTPNSPAIQLADKNPTIEQSMLAESRRGEVRDAIATLPKKQRAAVLMHKYEEMEYSLIAKALSCSESAVKSLVCRAYASLRPRLSHLRVSRSALAIASLSVVLAVCLFLRYPFTPSAPGQQSLTRGAGTLSPALVEGMDGALDDLDLLDQLDGAAGETGNARKSL